MEWFLQGQKNSEIKIDAKSEKSYTFHCTFKKIRGKWE